MVLTWRAPNRPLNSLLQYQLALRVCVAAPAACMMRDDDEGGYNNQPCQPCQPSAHCNPSHSGHQVELRQCEGRPSGPPVLGPRRSRQTCSPPLGGHKTAWTVLPARPEWPQEPAFLASLPILTARAAVFHEVQPRSSLQLVQYGRLHPGEMLAKSGMEG